MAKVDLDDAKREKNEEFLAQHQDIEGELNPYIEFDPKLSGKRMFHQLVFALNRVRPLITFIKLLKKPQLRN